MRNPFRYFNSSPEVMMYIRYPLSLRQVEDLLFERGIDICHETVRFYWRCMTVSARFSLTSSPMFNAWRDLNQIHGKNAHAESAVDSRALHWTMIKN